VSDLPPVWSSPQPWSRVREPTVGGMPVFGHRCGTAQRSAVAARKWPVPSVSPARASSQYAVVGAGPRGCPRRVTRGRRPPRTTLRRTVICGASALKGSVPAPSPAARRLQDLPADHAVRRRP
jgi:hypothetical protein